LTDPIAASWLKLCAGPRPIILGLSWPPPLSARINRSARRYPQTLCIVGVAQRDMLDLKVFLEYALHGLSMNTDLAIM
jgi:hypothetical protein